MFISISHDVFFCWFKVESLVNYVKSLSYYNKSREKILHTGDNESLDGQNWTKKGQQHMSHMSGVTCCRLHVNFNQNKENE